MDWQSVSTAADISDQLVGGLPRYTIDGRIDVSVKPIDALTSMMSAGNGSVIPIVDGKIQIFAGEPGATPVVNISEGDMLSQVSVSTTKSRRTNFNTVMGKYSGLETNWKTTSYQTVFDSSGISATGQIVTKNLSLPFTTLSTRCQQIALYYVNIAQRSFVMSVVVKPKHLDISVMSNVKISFSQFGWVDKVFRVIGWHYSHGKGIALDLEYNDPTIYSALTFTPPVPPTQAYTPAFSGSRNNLNITVNGLELFGQGNITEFSGRDAVISWRNVTPNSLSAIGSEIWGANGGTFTSWFSGYVVTILSLSGVVLRTENVASNAYTYTYEKNIIDAGGPHRGFVVEVRIMTSTGRIESAAILSVSNPAPMAAQNLSVTASINYIHVDFDKPTDLDFSGTSVWVSQTPGFTPDATTLVSTSTTNSVIVGNLTNGAALVPGQTYYVVVGVNDLFDNNPVLSAEQAVTLDLISSSIVDTTPPSTPANMVVTPTVSVGPYPVSSFLVSWDASTDIGGKVSKYYVAATDPTSTNPPVKTVEGAGSLTTILSGLVPGVSYDVTVTAVDWASNVSTPAASTVTAIGKTVATIVTPSLTATPGLGHITLSWSLPTNSDLQYVRILSGPTGSTPSVVEYEGLGTSFVYLSPDPTVSRSFAAQAVDTTGIVSTLSSTITSSATTISAATITNYIASAAIGTAQISSLDAGTITTGTMSGNRISVGTLTADKISATTLSAISADMGTVTAGTISGATVNVGDYLIQGTSFDTSNPARTLLSPVPLGNVYTFTLEFTIFGTTPFDIGLGVTSNGFIAASMVEHLGFAGSNQSFYWDTSGSGSSTPAMYFASGDVVKLVWTLGHLAIHKNGVYVVTFTNSISDLRNKYVTVLTNYTAGVQSVYHNASPNQSTRPIVLDNAGITLSSNLGVNGRLNPDGSGFFGSGSTAMSWDTAGVLSVPAAAVGALTASSVHVASGSGSGYYIDINPTNPFYFGNGTTAVLQLNQDGSSSFAGSLSAATGSFAGSLNAATGSFAGSLTAATGSFSGAVTAGAGSVIDGVHITTATIDTLHLKNNAVTSMASVYVANMSSALYNAALTSATTLTTSNSEVISLYILSPDYGQSLKLAIDFVWEVTGTSAPSTTLKYAVWVNYYSRDPSGIQSWSGPNSSILHTGLTISGNGYLIGSGSTSISVTADIRIDLYLSSTVAPGAGSANLRAFFLAR